MTFFTLMGATFYLAYYMQAVRGYTPLAAGVALIAVAAAVMISAPLSARLSQRFGPRMVTGTGMTLFGVVMFCFALTTQTMPQWVIEAMLVAMGTGMGFTMSPATNAIMGAVPREKAGAGSAVNNTVRQVAGALGVAILGSILAVAFRSHLGAGTPARVAAQLDQPAAVVAQLPASERATSYVRGDTSQSIGNAFEFTGEVGQALRARGSSPFAAGVPAAQRAQIEASDKATLAGFLSSAKSAFMTGMHVSSLFAGLAALLGALVSFRFLPTRREMQTVAATHGAPAAEHTVAFAE
jgi:DHA2 family integral membrane protein (MFS transporter)